MEYAHAAEKKESAGHIVGIYACHIDGIMNKWVDGWMDG